jgi:hypothetical protein
MSTTHAWWPKSVGMVIPEATMIGVLTAVAAWAGAARPRMAAVSPLATTPVVDEPTMSTAGSNTAGYR